MVLMATGCGVAHTHAGKKSRASNTNKVYEAKIHDLTIRVAYLENQIKDMEPCEKEEKKVIGENSRVLYLTLPWGEEKEKKYAIVKRGDTFWLVAYMNHTSLKKLLSVNPAFDPSKIDGVEFGNDGTAILGEILDNGHIILSQPAKNIFAVIQVGAVMFWRLIIVHINTIGIRYEQQIHAGDMLWLQVRRVCSIGGDKFFRIKTQIILSWPPSFFPLNVFDLGVIQHPEECFMFPVICMGNRLVDHQCPEI